MKFPRTPRSIDIEITSRCNLRCRYCSHFGTEGEAAEDLPAGEWLAFFEELGRAAVLDVCLSGGEPFIRKDLPEILEGIVQNRMRFSILTNGTLITDEWAGLIAATGRCNLVQVSIDGSHGPSHDIFRGEGAFAAAMEGLKRLIAHDVPTSVRVTIHKGNVHELDRICELLLDSMGLPEISTNSAVPLGLCRRNREQVRLSVEERSLAMGSLLRLSRRYPGRILASAGPLAEARQWMAMEQAARLGADPPPGGGRLTACSGAMSKIAIRADGMMLLCGQIPGVTLGRINSDHMVEVWQDHPELNLFRERSSIPLSTFEYCRDCRYVDYCPGECPAPTYGLSGDSCEPADRDCFRRFLEDGGALPDELLLTSGAVGGHGTGRTGALRSAGPPPQLRNVYFYLTGDCNLRCRHCWIVPDFVPQEGEISGLDESLFASILHQAKPLGLESVKLTGGEPLIHPGIGEILGHIRSAGVSLGIETNGVACTPALARMISECKDPMVSVSLDGPDSDTHEWMRGVKGCFREALKGVENLVRVGIRPQIIMCVARSNAGSMKDLTRLAESLGASSVKFNLVQPANRGERMREAGETLSIEELVDLGRWVETRLAPSASIPVIFSQPLAFRPLGRLLHAGSIGCDICNVFNILGVLADGSYAICGIGRTVPELLLGDAASDALEDVWRDSTVLRSVRDGLPDRLEGVCKDCVMKRMCLGSCIAQNYYESGSLWAPFWFCKEALKARLFPGTRIVPGRESALMSPC